MSRNDPWLIDICLNESPAWIKQKWEIPFSWILIVLQYKIYSMKQKLYASYRTCMSCGCLLLWNDSETHRFALISITFYIPFVWSLYTLLLLSTVRPPTHCWSKSSMLALFGNQIKHFMGPYFRRARHADDAVTWCRYSITSQCPQARLQESFESRTNAIRYLGDENWSRFLTWEG